MNELDAAEVGLNLTFRDRTLLLRALTHRSYINENPGFPLEDNERLEFLGDAVLDYVSAEYLYHHFPEMREGQLTGMRAALVRTETLAHLALHIGLDQFIRLGRGEEEAGGRKRLAILCDGFEALIGALCLDQGLEAARAYLHPLIEPVLDEILTNEADKDSKSRLQELSQRHLQITPAYRTIEEQGPDHDRRFTIAALIGSEVYGTGSGRNKQAAAQAAARAALERLEQELLERQSLEMELDTLEMEAPAPELEPPELPLSGETPGHDDAGRS
jgi:ribonuclease-3